ncbi:MAG: hypothetical protein A07HR60_01980, partial [uncultured archaeon A07HR60]
MVPDGTGEEGAIVVANILVVIPKEVSLEAVHSGAIRDGDHSERARFTQGFEAKGQVCGGDIHRYSRSGRVISEIELHQMWRL